jgi:hypothetical protein
MSSLDELLEIRFDYPDNDYPDNDYPDNDYPDNDYPDNDYPDKKGGANLAPPFLRFSSPYWRMRRNRALLR